jgi:hypothetical protein
MSKSSVVHLPHSSGIKSHWEISQDCCTCGGYKTYETISHGVAASGPYQDYIDHPCDECDSDGKQSLDEPRSFYDTHQDVLEDYPKAHITLYIQENES